MVALNKNAQIDLTTLEPRTTSKQELKRLGITHEIVADVGGEMVKVLVMTPTKIPRPSRN